MKVMCFGTMVTLLYQSRKRKTDSVRNICDGVFSAYGLSIDDFKDKTMPNHVKSGHDTVPGDLVKAARASQMEETVDGVEHYLIDWIHVGKKKALVRAIKKVLEDDPCGDQTPIYTSPDYEKCKILSMNTFDLSALLANVLTYSILEVDNRSCAEAIKEIDDDFVDSLVNADDPVYFEQKNIEQDSFSPIKRTIKDPGFDRVFTKVSESQITTVGNTSFVNTYYIIPKNRKFRFDRMREFIINNIGGFVFSRAAAKKIYDRTKSEVAVGSQAMLKFVSQYGQSTETVLGEILLYILLEQTLDAPKVMSSMEMDHFQWNSSSRGVHLLTAEKSGRPFHQLIFGASDLNGNIRAAIDQVFISISKIENRYDKEMHMVEGAAQWVSYSQEELKFLVELIKPTRGRSFASDMSFGAFIGYTVKLEHEETDSEKYKEAIRMKLIADINAIQSYLEEKIKIYGLEGHSFYFYFFPFNDADAEKISIIQELLSGGDVE